MTDFKREQRYLAAKVKDAEKALTPVQYAVLNTLLEKVDRYRIAIGKIPLKCVCIDSDWGCYEKVWGLVEQESTCQDKANKEGQ